MSLTRYLKSIEQMPSRLKEIFQKKTHPLDEELWEEWTRQVEWTLDHRLEALERAAKEGRVEEATRRIEAATEAFLELADDIREQMGIDLEQITNWC